METNKASKLRLGHVILCLVLLVIFVVTIAVRANTESNTESMFMTTDSDILPLKDDNIYKVLSSQVGVVQENEDQIAGPKEEVSVKRTEFDAYITEYQADIELLSNTFGIDYNLILEDLKSRYNEDEFSVNNVGYLRDINGELIEYHTPQYGLVEYFYEFMEMHPDLVNNQYVPYYGSSKYVEDLIIYFTQNIYTNVDTAIALSIGAAESGYYQVKYMLSVNNVYGGMSSTGLIHHKNIEYGVLSYVRMLSRNYFGKGLTSISSIGYVYCPTKDSSGNKIASPHWINLVSTAMNKYQGYNFDINAIDLLAEK